MTTTRDALVRMGIYPNLKGFNEIIEAVKYIKKNPSSWRAMELYQHLSDIFKTTRISAERNIRHAVTVAESKMLYESWPFEVDRRDNLKNCEFLALMAEYTEG